MSQTVSSTSCSRPMVSLQASAAAPLAMVPSLLTSLAQAHHSTGLVSALLTFSLKSGFLLLLLLRQCKTENGVFFLFLCRRMMEAGQSRWRSPFWCCDCPPGCPSPTPKHLPARPALMPLQRLLRLPPVRSIITLSTFWVALPMC